MRPGTVVALVCLLVLTCAYVYRLYDEGEIHFSPPGDRYYHDGYIHYFDVDGGGIVYKVVWRFWFVMWFEESALRYPKGGTVTGRT